jgi:hypothetical protein
MIGRFPLREQSVGIVQYYRSQDRSMLEVPYYLFSKFLFCGEYSPSLAVDMPGDDPQEVKRKFRPLKGTESSVNDPSADSSAGVFRGE